MSAQKFYAVRVEITTSAYKGGHGFEVPSQVYVRDYVRGNMRMGRDKFDRYAIGDLIMLLGFYYMEIPFKVYLTEIDADGKAIGGEK